MKTKGSIVRKWREERGWSPAKLGAAVGTSRQNIENLEADTVESPRYLRRLSSLMGYSTVEELIDLCDPPQIVEGIAHRLILDKRTVALTEPLRLEWGDLMSDQLPRAFRVTMPDNAMAPAAPLGRTVVFDLASTAEAGKRILVRDSDGAVYFRRYKRVDVSGHWRAVPDNDNFPALDSIEHGLTVIARMRYIETPDED